jgi:hypothetical protein
MEGKKIIAIHQRRRRYFSKFLNVLGTGDLLLFHADMRGRAPILIKYTRMLTGTPHLIDSGIRATDLRLE